MVISHGWLDNLPWSMDPSYLFFWGYLHEVHNNPSWHRGLDRNIWPRFKIHDTSVSSMLLSFLASRICRAIRSAIILRMLASWHVADPGRKNLPVARCSMHICLRCVWFIWKYKYIYIYMNIYDHIWRIYIYIYYMNMGYKVDVFIIRKTNIKNKKMHHKRWIFQGPWVWDAHHHPMKWGWLIYNHMVQHDTGI